jgi:hypothetical protein
MQGKQHLWKGIWLASSRRNMSVSFNFCYFDWFLCACLSWFCSALVINLFTYFWWIQQLLVWKFILWISSLTVVKLDSIAGIQPVKRSLVVLEMDTSKWLFVSILDFCKQSVWVSAIGIYATRMIWCLIARFYLFRYPMCNLLCWLCGVNLWKRWRMQVFIFFSAGFFYGGFVFKVIVHVIVIF